MGETDSSKKLVAIDKDYVRRREELDTEVEDDSAQYQLMLRVDAVEKSVIVLHKNINKPSLIQVTE